MAEELGIKLKIDTKEGIAKARDEIEKFIHEYKDRSIKLKIFDKGDFANLSENIKQVSNQVNNLSQVLGSKLEVRSLDEVNKQFGIMLTRVDSLEKVKVTGEGMEAFTQEIVKGVDAAGKLITATRNLDKTGKIRIREKNDYAGEAKDAEKLAKAKEKIADAEEKNTLKLQAKRVTAVNKRIADEQKALEKLAKAKDVELDKEERKQLQLDLKRVNTVNTRVAKEQKAAEDIRKANEKAADAEEKNIQRLQLKRVKAVEQRTAKAERAAKAESDSIFRAEEAYARLQNRLMRMDSSKVYSMLMGKDSNLSDARSDIATKMKALFTEMENGTLTIEKLKQSGITREIDKLGANLEVAKNKMGGFTAELLTNITSFVRWYAIGNLVGSVRREIVKLVDTVKDLNKQLVNLQMATGYDYDSTLKLMQSYSALGAKIGATTSEVASSADAFLRQGQTIEDTNTLIYASMVLSKVGQIESATSTEYLTAAMKAYGVQVNDVIGIVDKLSSVDVKSATSAGGLAEAMSRTATAAQLAGISMDKLLGYLAVVGETTQKQMSEVGTSFQAIFSRMGNVKAGKSIDDEGESLNDVEKVLNRLQINLRDSQYQFRNFGDVLDEVAGKWKTYTNVEQNQIATAVAGKQCLVLEYIVIYSVAV